MDEHSNVRIFVNYGRKKFYNIGSVVVEHSTNNPKREGSNPAYCTVRENLVGKAALKYLMKKTRF